jgi:glycosyltransferase involved in cell wall biosynthesis
MNQFYNMEDIEFELSLFFSNNEHIRTAEFSNHKTFFPNLVLGIKNYYTRHLNSRNEGINLSAIAEKKYDLLHPTYYKPYFLSEIGDKPFVITIHDMTYEIYVDEFEGTNKTAEEKKLLAQKAAKIITVSENTKNDVIKYYNIDAEKISVTHLASSIEYGINKTLNIKLPQRYFLFVGNRKVYKNFYALIKVFSQIKKQFNDLYLVCAGGGVFSKKEKNMLRELNLFDRVLFHQVNDEKLSYLYSKAIAFVFPSLYEGFGIPVLEAFECRCPVLVSNVSSLPEVAGNAALYFDPQSEISIKEALVKILSDNELREKLVLAGKKRAKEFSWKKTAMETQLAYESIL